MISNQEWEQSLSLCSHRNTVVTGLNHRIVSTVVIKFLPTNTCWRAVELLVQALQRLSVSVVVESNTANAASCCSSACNSCCLCSLTAGWSFWSEPVRVQCHGWTRSSVVTSGLKTELRISSGSGSSHHPKTWHYESCSLALLKSSVDVRLKPKLCL